MSELEQILQYEEQKKHEITSARLAAREAVEKKREQLEKTVAYSGLGPGESKEMAEKTAASIKELEASLNKAEKDGLEKLEASKAAKLEKAIDFIVSSFKDATA
ncbi:MAG: hypothetical protein PHU56_02060 [Candidatus Pacebacteria bacterium]|nr:hypothetical protein [Candidatus Paceibacterota bacterium]